MPKREKLVLASVAREKLANEQFALAKLDEDTYVLKDEDAAIARVMELTGAPRVEFVPAGTMQIPGERPLAMLSIFLDTEGRVSNVRNG